MEVLAEPKDNKEVPSMNLTCTGQGFSNKGCGRLLKAAFYDIQSDTHRDYGGGIDTYYYINCPVCGARTQVYKSQMPKEMLGLI